jgi:hypothetical protein
MQRPLRHSFPTLISPSSSSPAGIVVHDITDAVGRMLLGSQYTLPTTEADDQVGALHCFGRAYVPGVRVIHKMSMGSVTSHSPARYADEVLVERRRAMPCKAGKMSFSYVSCLLVYSVTISCHSSEWYITQSSENNVLSLLIHRRVEFATGLRDFSVQHSHPERSIHSHSNSSGAK